MSLIFILENFTSRSRAQVSSCKAAQLFRSERVTQRGIVFPQVIPNEIHYHLQGWQRASLPKVQTEAHDDGRSAGAIPQLLVKQREVKYIC